MQPLPPAVFTEWKALVKKALETIATVVCALCIIAGIVALIARSPISGVVPGLKDTTPMVVMSGSMEPRLPVGGLVFVKPVDARAVAVGDIIAFAEPKTPDSSAPQLTTHRVVAVDNGPTGLVFKTKGDANSTADALPVSASSVVGIADGAVPYLGYAAAFVRSPAGFIALILIPALVIIGGEGQIVATELRRNRESRGRDAEHAECAEPST